jgi:hypothetical protein
MTAPHTLVHMRTKVTSKGKTNFPGKCLNLRRINKWIMQAISLLYSEKLEES